VPFWEGRVLGGVYHEKLGFFRDRNGRVVAFTGSNNESEHSVWANFESLWVYTTWGEEAYRRDALDIVEMFERRWRDEQRGLLVVDFPSAPREWLEGRAPRELGTSPVTPHLVGRGPMPPPWEHQERAIRKWVAAGRRGILQMATGTGKTYAALLAVQADLEQGRPVIIAVPKRGLQDQWIGEIRKHYPDARVFPVPGDGTWKQPGVLGAWLQDGAPTFVVGVTNTLASDAFMSRLGKLSPKPNATVVVDEVHHIGSPQRSRFLEFEADRRLGLGATPWREFDPEGNERIKAFFGDVVYTFPLGDAIREGRLTPYDYHLVPLELEVEEVDRYLDLSRKIAGMVQSLAEDIGAAATLPLPTLMASAHAAGFDDRVALLQRILFARADVSKDALGKPRFAREQLLAHPDLTRVLVYCDDLDQLQRVGEELAEADVIFVRYEGNMGPEERRATLNALRTGTARAALSMHCLDEGIDIPSCDGAIILASSKTERQFIQRRGRVLRRHAGKTHSVIIDPIVVPPERHAGAPGVVALVEAELARASVFVRDAENRFVAEAQARRIARTYGAQFDIEDEQDD
jgi:superfamily II DNA or RNA helicase